MIERSLETLPAPGARALKIFFWFAILASIAFGASGCANTAKSGAAQTAYAARIEEQKKIPAQFLYPKKLPPMTDDDIERLGDSYLHQGKLVEAFTQYDKLLRKHPDNCGLLFKRGTVYLLKGRFQESLADFREILE